MAVAKVKQKPNASIKTSDFGAGSKQIQMGDMNFIVREVPVLEAIGLIKEMELTGMTPELVEKLLTRSCSIGSKQLTKEDINSKFKGKPKLLIELFEKVLELNLGDLIEDPNAESDSESE